MYNPFDLIPKTIDKNLRDFIIVLIIIQFTAFILRIGYLVYDFVKYRREKNNGTNQESEIDSNSNKNEKETLAENQDSERLKKE
jgi:hypothetical protein